MSLSSLHIPRASFSDWLSEANTQCFAGRNKIYAPYLGVLPEKEFRPYCYHSLRMNDSEARKFLLSHFISPLIKQRFASGNTMQYNYHRDISIILQLQLFL